MDDQEDLASLAEDLAARGINVVISNHYTNFTKEIYASATDLINFKVRRYISCNPNARKMIKEVLAVFAV